MENKYDEALRKVFLTRACLKFQWRYLSDKRRKDAMVLMTLGYEVEKQYYLRKRHDSGPVDFLRRSI